MASHTDEEATVRAFVVAAKRQRLLDLLTNPKRRKQAIESLNHFSGWDERCAVSIHSSANIVSLLREAGSPEICHVISDDPSIDGRDLPLHEAVEAAESFSFASLLCGLPGQVACFFDEASAPRRRLLLRRPA